MDDLHLLIHKRKDAFLKCLPKVGSDISPDRQSLMSIWKKYCDNCPPDMGLIMHNLSTQEISRTHHLNKIGFSFSTTNDIIQSTHENHRLALIYNLLTIANLAYKYYPKQTIIQQIIHTNLRAIKDINGEFQYVKVISQPISTDSEGYIMDYISWYTPLCKYDGQAIKTKLIPLTDNPKILQVRKKYQKLMIEAFDYLKFTNRQRDIILLTQESKTKQEIANHLNISIRTVEKYKEQIFNKGKMLFSENKFKSADDVVFHLSEMGYI